MSNKPAQKQPQVGKMNSSQLRDELGKLDEEIKALVNTTLEQLEPGKPFNPAIVRNISKIEARKHRLLSTRLVALLKKGHPDVKEIVDRLITIEV